MIEVVKENKKEIPSYDLVKAKIYKEWLKNEIILKTKEKAKKLIKFNKNQLPFQNQLKELINF